MVRRNLLALPALLALAPALSQAPATYFPPPGEAWEHRSPAAVDLDSAALVHAVAYAVTHETSAPRELDRMLAERFRGPWDEIVGPVKPRGDPSGLVLRQGYIVAEWGDTRRVDMTFSVTKSFVATAAGLAFDRGLIRDLRHRVADYVTDGGFDSPHNAKITWHHLLQQTSEWEGRLFGKPDSADRRRGVERALREPGTFWEYNDVRVNRAALALLQVWRRGLPDVVREHVMDPIGASDTWEWHGYRNSRVEVDGRAIESVSGGGHWGGGLWISARDLARFGYLHLRRGRWGDRQLLSERWIDRALSPSEQHPVYGYMWWLNTDRGMWPSAPARSFAALGAGTNVVWVDPDHDLVVVLRWIEGRAVDETLRRVLAAVRD
ncbi:MAG: serine hydrolase domain-containing protein [Gemmatimonadales bacterium]